MTVRLELRGGKRVVLRSPWTPSLAGQCKNVPGFYFSKADGSWSYPLSMQTLHNLRAEFGDELRPTDELMAWAKAQSARERELRRLSRRKDATLRRVPQIAPALAQAMAGRTYQRSGARFAAAAHSYLLADEPGLGKTVVYLAGLVEGDMFEDDHLVIAPKTALESTWGRQIGLWTPQAEYVAMPEGAAAREKAWEQFLLLDQPRFLIINPAMLRRLYGHWCKKCDVWEEDVKRKKNPVVPPLAHYLEDHRYKRVVRSESWPEILNHNWRTAVIDESHQVLAAYQPSNVSQTTQGLLDLKTGDRIALTGTPLRGQEKRIWGTAAWLGHTAGGYWKWVDEYFDTTENYFGKSVGELADGKRKDFYMWMDSFVLRRTRAEVRPDLPLGQRMDVLVNMTPKHAKQYEIFEQEGEVKLSTGIIAGLGTLSEFTRLKQFSFGVWHDPNHSGRLEPTADSAAFEWTAEFLRQRGITGGKDDWYPEPGSGYKYVIASQFTQIIDFVERELNRMHIPTLKITGAVTGTKRTDAVELFQSEDKRNRVMLIQTVTGGASIELDAWCDEMVILDETFVADDQVQLEGRINNRSGRVAPRLWWYVRTADTIQQKIAESNMEQHTLQHNLLDGRRGVKTALHLLRGKS